MTSQLVGNCTNIMKTIKNILFLLLVLALGFTSCKEDPKDEPIIPPVVVEQPTEITVSTYGQLAITLASSGIDLTKITSLIVKGNIDSVDFVTLKNIESLSVLDLSGCSLANDEIPVGAFQGKTSLTSISLPPCLASNSRLVKIDDNAFSGCTNLTAIYTNSEFPTTLGSNVFDVQTKTKCTLYIKQDGAGTANDETWQIPAFRDAWGWTGNIVVQ